MKDIGEGNIPFDKIIATPEHMPTLKAMARILGPKGLMPNIKSGTLVKQHELIETVKKSKEGLVEFRVDSSSYIKGMIGKRPSLYTPFPKKVKNLNHLKDVIEISRSS